MPDPLPIAKNRDTELCLLPALANRHGLITGATGTGKTVTLQVMAERFSQIGVPVFMADVKGDLSGITQPGAPSPKLLERLKLIGVDEPAYAGMPGRLLGRLRRTGSSDPRDRLRPGPAAAVARARTSTKRRRACWRSSSRSPTTTACCCSISRISARCCSTSAITRRSCRPTTATSPPRASARSSAACSRSSSRARERFIGEPMLNVDDLLQTGDGGRGVVNILVADKLMNAPTLYSTLLLWLLSELYERLPEVGDRDKPKLVFFFDEAHLLFTDAPKIAAGQDRAGRAPDPLEGRRRLFRHAESARRAGDGAGPARQSRPARAARVHAARPEGGQGGGRNDARQPENRHRKGDHRARRRRSAGVVPRREGTARRWSSARSSCRRAAGSAPQRRRSGSASSRRPGLAGVYDKAIDRESAYERLKGRAAGARRPPAAPRPHRAAAGRIRSRTRSAGSSPAAGARTASSKRWRRAPRERSDRRSAAKSSAACWARCWAAGATLTVRRFPLSGTDRRPARRRRGASCRANGGNDRTSGGNTPVIYTFAWHVPCCEWQVARARFSRLLPTAMFKLLRYFSLTSFVSVVIVAAILAVFYRELAVHSLVAIGRIQQPGGDAPARQLPMAEAHALPRRRRTRCRRSGSPSIRTGNSSRRC